MFLIEEKLVMSFNADKSAAVARQIRERIDDLAGRKSPSQICREIGFENDRIIYAFASGEFRVPLDRAIPLALALEIDPGEFFSAALASYFTLSDGLKITFDRGKTPIKPAVEAGDEYSRAVKNEDGAVAGSRHIVVDLNFKVSAEFHRSFKGAAAARGISMKELLEASFQAYLRSESEAISSTGERW